MFWQKIRSNRILTAVLLSGFLLLLTSANVVRKSTVTFIAHDSLVITADEYLTDETHPYIILFHEQHSSRGEFQTIARKLCKMDYNCLAVDLRNGGNRYHVSNETVKRCQRANCDTDMDAVKRDMHAAIDYAYGKSNLPVILMGSTINASLSLIAGMENERVKAVVALSPGEYFRPQFHVQDSVADIRKPVLVTSSQSELPYVSELVSGIEDNYLNLFEPALGEGGRGSESLQDTNPTNSEYWLALLLFFKELM